MAKRAKSRGKRVKTFQMRLTTREKRLLFRAADAASMEASAWARRCLCLAAESDLKRSS